MAAFESRLRTIENQLPHQITPSEPVAVEIGRAISPADDPVNPYEGESSFSQQLLEASHISEETLTGTVELNTSFVDLHTLAETSSKSEDYRFSQNDGMQGATSFKVSLPFVLVTAILRRMKGMCR